MPPRQCFHCKQWIEPGADHNCWTTTEGALTRELPEDLREAWERLRETAAEFGEQRIYASHHSIMFSRKACYFFVRPHAKRLEVCFFLGRHIRHPQIRSARPSSTAKVAHIVHVRHRDEVEVPLTDWLREAHEVSDELTGKRTSGASVGPPAASKPRTKVTRARAAGTPARRKTAKAARPKKASRRG